MMGDSVARRPLTRRQFGKIVLGGLAVGAGCDACGGALPIAPAATIAAFPGHLARPLLVDAAWLRGALQGEIEPPLVIDVSAIRRYRTGHIPGAVHAWWQDTIEVDDPVYGTVVQPINSTDQRKRLRVLETFGIEDGRQVVVYDDDRGRWAARMVWFLRFLGHDEVAALDGGLAAWRGNGGPTTAKGADPPSGLPPTVTPRVGYYVGTDGDDGLVARLADPATLLVDVRTDREARDDVNDLLPVGRIPGAVSLPWDLTLRDDTGRLKSPEALSALLESAGLSPERRVVLYARFGVETAQTWLVLKLMGYPDVVVYDRGWAGWATTPGLPIASL
jgi:thiosulfate/3-mercaptopyruvate sulfurtransferase